MYIFLFNLCVYLFWCVCNIFAKLVGVDYLSVAPYDYLIPAGLVFLKRRVRSCQTLDSLILYTEYSNPLINLIDFPRTCKTLIFKKIHCMYCRKIPCQLLLVKLLWICQCSFLKTHSKTCQFFPHFLIVALWLACPLFPKVLGGLAGHKIEHGNRRFPSLWIWYLSGAYMKKKVVVIRVWWWD